MPRKRPTPSCSRCLGHDPGASGTAVPLTTCCAVPAARLRAGRAAGCQPDQDGDRHGYVTRLAALHRRGSSRCGRRSAAVGRRVGVGLGGRPLDARSCGCCSGAAISLRVFAVATPLTGIPRDRWRRSTAALVRGPKRPSTGPGRSPCRCNLTWSARTRGDPSGCAKPAPRRSGSFVARQRVRTRTDDPVGRDLRGSLKRVTAASVRGPYNPSTGPGCQPSLRSVR